MEGQAKQRVNPLGLAEISFLFPGGICAHPANWSVFFPASQLLTGGKRLNN